ncbi:MAG: hypothetical protein AB1716_12855 [Planctomycetota bacterium]
MRTRVVVGATWAAAAFSVPLQADIHSYAVSKSVGYTQTSNAQPTTPDNWLLTAQLYYSEPNEVLTATLSFNRPPPVTFDFYRANSTNHLYYSTFYTSEAALDLDYPSTTYTVTLDRGGGPETGDVFLPVGLYCPEIPYFTGDTYDRLQHYDPALAFDGTINGFTLAPGTNYGYTSVAIAEPGVGGVWSISLTPEATAFQIPPGVLQPGRYYDIGVAYVDMVQTQNAGFGAATSSAEFQRGTSFAFTTLPFCRGDCNCDGVVDFGDINSFVAVLGGGTPCIFANCDVNGDGAIDFGDINPFVALLSGGGGPCR